MGAVNFESSVHLLSRRPLRQWSRGFKQDVIYDFCRDKTASSFCTNLTLLKAEATFNRVWITPKEGLAKIRNGTMHSFAMNNSYWFSGTPKHQYVWRNKVCIGEILGKQIFYFSESSLLQEEINTDLKEVYAHL